MTWNNQPARTASPNDIPSDAAALPNDNTTVVLGSAAFGTTAGEIVISLNLPDVRAFLANDSNQQITLLFHNTANNNASWASVANTGGHPVPTLELAVSPGGGGPGVLTLANAANDWAGTTTIHHGTVKLGAGNVLPHGIEKGDVILVNSNPTNASTLDLNGFGVTINGLLSSGDPARCIITNSSGAAAVLTVGGNDAHGVFGGSIRNGAGIVGLTKIGEGAQTLTGAQSYTGATIVSNGTLLVSGSLGNTAVTVRDGATLAGNGTLNGSVTIHPGGTLSPGPSIDGLTINGAVTLQGTTFMELNKALGTNDVIRGVTTLQYGGTLHLTNLAGALADGDSFKLFDAIHYSGAYAKLKPAIPAAGLAWNMETLTSDGILRIIAAPTPPPNIGEVKLNGTDLVVRGMSGVPGWTFYVLASTNLAAPPIDWTRVATNAFDDNGAFHITWPVMHSLPQQYYRIELAP